MIDKEIYMANRNKLFFLGSGASACAGIPTFSTFKDKTEEIAEGMDELCGNNNKDITSQNIVGLITATIEKSIVDIQKKLPYDYLANNHYPVITTNCDFILDSYGKRLEKGLIDYCGIKKHPSPGYI